MQIDCKIWTRIVHFKLRLVSIMKSDKLDSLIIGGFICVVVVAVIYAFVLFMSCMVALGGSDPSFSNSSITKEAFGLESGKEYPLQFGERIQGSSGEATASAGFFSASASVSLQPASALSVAFHYGARSYILELPMSKIVFLQRKNVPETIKIVVGGDQYGGDRYGIYFDWILHEGAPKPLEDQGWFQDLKQNGKLGEFLQPSWIIESVKVTLTPQDYNKILGWRNKRSPWPKMTVRGSTVRSRQFSVGFFIA